MAAIERDILQNRLAHYTNIFRSQQAREVVQYVRREYGGELEFLWVDSPQYAVFRHAHNKKWYGVLMAVSGRCLGLGGGAGENGAGENGENAGAGGENGATCDILNVKLPAATIAELIDGRSFFAAYHMNKKHWISIRLGSGLAAEAIFALIDKSYQLTHAKRR